MSALSRTRCTLLLACLGTACAPHRADPEFPALHAPGAGARRLAGCYEITFGEWSNARNDFAWPAARGLIELRLESRPWPDPAFAAFAARFLSHPPPDDLAPGTALVWATPRDSSAVIILSHGDIFYGYSATLILHDSSWTGPVHVYSDLLVRDRTGTLSTTVADGRATARRVRCPATRPGTAQ